jgi:hypothetical protein
MKRLLTLTLLPPLLLFPPAGHGGEAARVWIEHATDPSGPWTKIDLATAPKDPAGNPVLPLQSSRWFFRTQMQLVPDGAGSTIPLSDVPEESLKQAEAMLRDGKDSLAGWPVDCVLGPDVYPVYDKASNRGVTPAFLEFKVMRNLPVPDRSGFPRNFSEDCTKPDAGSLFIALTDIEAPQLESSNEGPAVTEKLWELARRRDVKIFRFGADFFAAEDMAGNLVANFGTQPFKPDPGLVTELTEPLVWEGDDELGTDSRPERPNIPVGVYQNYIDFCNDYLTNPVYQKLRERRAVRAKLEWNVERGVMPEIITLKVGEEQVILPEKMIREFNFDTEDETATVRVLPAEFNEPGLKLAGAAVGQGILNVIDSDGVLTSFAVQVGDPSMPGPRSPRGTFEPGWQTVVETYVGDRSNQVRYVQMKSSDWPGYVGCGPNAWAMLLAWYEREKGLSAAFGNFATNDAPYEYLGDPGPAHGALKPVVKTLRTFCGTFDDPFSDASPTMPGEMPDGVLAYTSFPTMAGMLKRGWQARWSDLFQTLNGGGGAIEVRTAVKNGRCACVGLGNYWHYGVAYGYLYQEYKLVENQPPMFTRRRLRVNMGWGNGDGNWKWRDFYDTFFAMDFRLKKGPLHP